MKSRIYPTWEQIGSLKTTLTSGEYFFAKFLDENLPIDWEIYVQPYFNGDRPDIVILNPNVGLMIYEIKDWDLSLYETHYNNEDKSYFVTVIDKNKEKQKIKKPIEQVKRYRNNLFKYLPQLSERVSSSIKNLSAFKVGIYFHNATTLDAIKVVPDWDENHCSVIGKDEIKPSNLKKIVPDFDRKSSYLMSESWAEKIRFWLTPPFHSLEQGTPIQLTEEQSRHVNPSPQHHQRLRGVAGSGKTLVIAHRAANLAANGKKVLVVTFNITLWHHIRDQISRVRLNFGWEQFEFNHFHGFCVNYLSENDINIDQKIKGDAFLKLIVPQKIIDSMKSGKNNKKRKYDAILIDEAQDYERIYYEMLTMFLTENDEILLVADEKQNIYNTELNWLDSMSGTRFKGRWRELKKTARLPYALLDKANDFAKRFLPDVGLIPDGTLFNHDFFESEMSPKLIWRNVADKDIVEKVLAAFKWLTEQRNMSPSDIVILLPTHNEGLYFVEKFKKINVNVNHVFSADTNNKSEKNSFWMGDSRLKMCTIHSFKGWELQNVILVTPDSDNFPGLDFLMYIALTRSRKNLIVFNRLEKYNEYGSTWK